MRYADDFLLGFTGPKAEAEDIKRQLGAFLRGTLKLELSAEKTLVTHAATDAARFLGYDIVTQRVDDRHDRHGHRKVNGKVGLRLPAEVVRSKCAQYLRHGTPMHRLDLLDDDDFSILSRFQGEYRGIVQYYLLAQNVSWLWELHRVMRWSLLRTLARKHKTRVMEMVRRYERTIETPLGTLKCLEVVVERGGDKKPLIARFGGIHLRRQRTAILVDRAPIAYRNDRNELLKRLLADECEPCGATEGCEVHHIRKLADLKAPGRKEKPPWVKRMAARRRKTLVVCSRCHDAIHAGRPPRQRSLA